MLDRYLLRYFLAVIDQGNFSRAASQCNVSQPTLSVGIAKLEGLLGQKLFVRSNRRIELTSAGARFQIHARSIEREFNVALQAVEDAADPPALRIGILESIPSVRIANAIASTRSRRSSRVELVFGTERELASRLNKGRIDLALTLVSRGSERFVEQPILTEGYALALPSAHPLASAEQIEAEQLAHETMIVRRHCEALSETSKHFIERGVRPHFALRTSNDERTLEMVAAGLAVTVMPQSFQHPDVVRPLLSGFMLQRTIGWRALHSSGRTPFEPSPLISTITRAVSAGTESAGISICAVV